METLLQVLKGAFFYFGPVERRVTLVFLGQIGFLHRLGHLMLSYQMGVEYAIQPCLHILEYFQIFQVYFRNMFGYRVCRTLYQTPWTFCMSTWKENSIFIFLVLAHLWERFTRMAKIMFCRICLIQRTT